MSLSHKEHRFLEPIASLLRQQLRLPQIFFEQKWPPSNPHSPVAQILAIDDAGTADAHFVVVRESASDALLAIPELMKAQAHYKWIAFDESTVTKKIKQRIDSRIELDPPTGAGRVGVIVISPVGKLAKGPELKAELAVFAERFHGLKYSQVETYLKNVEPDIYTKV